MNQLLEATGPSHLLAIGGTSHTLATGTAGSLLASTVPATVLAAATTETLAIDTSVVHILTAGTQGPPGSRAAISQDPDNRLTTGTDSGLYVPNDLNPDPLAYYILSKA